MSEQDQSSLWEQSKSTKTITYMRSAVPGLWPLTFVIFAMFVVWALLQPGMLEKYFSLDFRANLERYRYLIGPFCLLPILILAIVPAKNLYRNPSFPGKKMLILLCLLSMFVFGYLFPSMSYENQLKKERYCREVALPELYKHIKAYGVGKRLASCPCQWESALGTYQLIEAKGILLCDLKAWHPSGKLALTTEGKVIVLEP